MRCGKCLGEHDRWNQRLCLTCHAAYMREWRKTHPLTAEQRRKDAARSYASVYKRSGLLVPQPCERCGSPNVEMHHLDYARPLAVRWLCREHRMELRAAVTGRRRTPARRP